MKLLSDWGFSSNSWQGQRGEYWVFVQGVLILGFAVLPVVRPAGWGGLHPLEWYWVGGAAIAIAGFGIILFVKGLLDLGTSLTPLPYPREDGQLVQSGVYRIVRHPVYSGVIFVAIAWALYQISLSHLLGALVCFIFFDAKARREEGWLLQKYPDYTNYQQQVRKLIPWLY